MKVLGRNLNLNPSRSTQRKTSAPVQESWRVDGVELGSTNAMLEKASDFDGVQATYTRTELRSKTVGEKVGDAFAGSAKGFIIGAATNAILSIATGGLSTAVSGALILGGYALGAVVGASGQPSETTSGTLTTDQCSTTFFPGDVASAGVEVTANEGPSLHCNDTGNLLA